MFSDVLIECCATLWAVRFFGPQFLCFQLRGRGTTRQTHVTRPISRPARHSLTLQRQTPHSNPPCMQDLGQAHTCFAKMDKLALAARDMNLSRGKPEAIPRLHGPTMRAVRDEFALSVDAKDDGAVRIQIDEQRSSRLLRTYNTQKHSSLARRRYSRGSRSDAQVAKLLRRLWLERSPRV